MNNDFNVKINASMQAGESNIKPIQLSLMQYPLASMMPYGVSNAKMTIDINKIPLAPEPIENVKVEDQIEQLLEQGIDISSILEQLEPTAAGTDVMGEGGQSFIVNPNLSMGQVDAGYPTEGTSFISNAFMPEVWLYTDENNSGDITQSITEGVVFAPESPSTPSAPAAPLPPQIELIKTAGVETITFTRENDTQQPYGNEEVANYLLNQARDGRPISGNIPVNGVDLANTVINIPTDVTINFVSEGAGHRNMIGYYFFNPDTKAILEGQDNAGFIWVDASDPSGRGTNLNENPAGISISQSSSFTISQNSIPDGAGIGFFLIENGASNNGNRTLINNYENLTDLNDNLELKQDTNGLWKVNINGQFINTSTYFTHDKALNHDFTTFNQGHALSGVSFDSDIARLDANRDYTSQLIVGFEDLRNGGDRDYEDVVFAVDLGANVQNLSASTIFLINLVEDPDSPVLVEARVHSQDFFNGDKLVLVNSANVKFDNGKVLYQGDELLTYTATNNEIVLSGEAAQSVYAEVLKQIGFSPDVSAASEDIVRNIDAEVMDETELIGSDTHSYTVVINDTLSYQSTINNQIDSMGDGDDLLLLPDTPSNIDPSVTNSPISGGAGFDTIKLQNDNMKLSLDDLKNYFSNDWEHIDMRDFGDNEIILDYNLVSQLLEDSSNELEINGNTVKVLQISGDSGDKIKIDLEANEVWQQVGGGTHDNLYEISNTADPGVPPMYVQLMPDNGAPPMVDV